MEDRRGRALSLPGGQGESIRRFRVRLKRIDQGRHVNDSFLSNATAHEQASSLIGRHHHASRTIQRCDGAGDRLEGTSMGKGVGVMATIGGARGRDCPARGKSGGLMRTGQLWHDSQSPCNV